MRTYPLLLLALLPFIASTSSAEIMMTEPIGVVSVTLKAGSDTRFSIPMMRNHVFTGEIKSVDEVGNAIELVNTNWANGRFVFEDPNNPDPNATYFVVVTSGNQNGAQYKIVSNDATTLSLEIGLNSLAGLSSSDVNGVGDTIKIYPYSTLGSVFAETMVPDQTEIFEYDNSNSSKNKSPQIIYTYYESFGAWGDGGPSAVDHTALLKVGEGYVARVPEGNADVQLRMPGAVGMFNDRKVFTNDAGSPNDVTFALSVPVPVAIGNTNLGIQDQIEIFVYDNESVAKRKSPSTILTYYANLNAWGDGGPTAVDNTFFLEPGISYVLRKPVTEVAEIVETSFIPDYLTQ